MFSTSFLAYGTTLVGSICSNTTFAGSGWSDCEIAITWTTDTINLSAEQKPKFRSDIEFAMNAWAAATGLMFTDRGEVSVTYNDATSAVQPVRSVKRNIAIYFVPDTESTLISQHHHAKRAGNTQVRSRMRMPSSAPAMVHPSPASTAMCSGTIRAWNPAYGQVFTDMRLGSMHSHGR